MQLLPAEPLVTPHGRLEPVSGKEARQAYLPDFQHVNLSEICCFMGAEPDASKITRVLCDDKLGQLWQLGGQPPGGKPILATFSTLPGLPYIGVHFCDDEAASTLPASRYLQIYGDILEALSAHFFASQKGDITLFTQTLIPTPDPLYDLHIDLGWEQFSTALLDRRPTRFLYGLERRVYDIFHQDV